MESTEAISEHAAYALEIASSLQRAASAGEKLAILQSNKDFFWSLPDSPDASTDEDTPETLELPEWRDVMETRLLYLLVDIVAAPARQVSGSAVRNLARQRDTNTYH